MCWAASVKLLSISWPLIWTWPEVRLISLVRDLKQVVFPAPLTPSIAKHSPADRPKDVFSTATILAWPSSNISIWFSWSALIYFLLLQQHRLKPKLYSFLRFYTRIRPSKSSWATRNASFLTSMSPSFSLLDWLNNLELFCRSIDYSPICVSIGS
jgi:hypothetical protein